MQIRVINPRLIGGKWCTTEQCSEFIPEDKRSRNKAWAKQSYVAENCQKAAGILIDNKPYCRQHAANIALERWIVGDLEESK